MMKIQPKTMAKLVGLTAGALVGGPLLGGLGATCGGFIGEMLEDEDQGGWGLGDSLKGIFGGIFANKIQPLFDEQASGFNHDLRRAAAAALVQALAWNKGEGPVAALLLKRDYFGELGVDRRKLLGDLFDKWRDHVQTALTKVEKAHDAALQDRLLPPGDDDALTKYADAKARADAAMRAAVAQAWGAFYDQTLKPVAEALLEGYEPGQLSHEKLRDGLTECLPAVFPGLFMEVMKSGDGRRAWMAYQKTLLTAIQRTVEAIGAQTQRLPKMEEKLDALLKAGSARVELDKSLATFITAVETKLDGTYENTLAIQALIRLSRESLETKLDEIAKAVSRIEAGVAELLQRKPLNQYLGNLTRRFSKHHSLGIPAVEDTKQRPGPDQIVDLFVQPTCTTGRLRPEDLPAAMEDAKRRPQPLLTWMAGAGAVGLPELARERRVVLLADPGMGKSTLIQWLVVSLCAPVPPAEVRGFGKTIPLPFILRDLVPLLPASLEKWTWQALVQAFLKHQHDKDQPGMAKPLADDEDTLREVLGSPQAWFLIDGLDEVGDKARREALRRALWEGFEAHPEARFLITSRVVGYEEAEVHRELQSMNPQGLSLSGMAAQSVAFMALSLLAAPQAQLLYLAPWNDAQQSSFAHHWFGMRLGDAEGPARAQAFVRAVHDHPSTRGIGRVPNLLLFMALLFRHRAALPHGRAKVYAGISHAYLEGISVVRRIQHRDVPYTLAQKERLLAVIAMHMQVRRAERDVDVSVAVLEVMGEDGSVDEEKLSRLVQRKTNLVLASRRDLEAWLCPEFARQTDGAAVHAMEIFIAHIADSSGLLLSQGVVDGVEQFAFAHLSFQEYYAASWLELEFSRLLNLHPGGEDLLEASPPVPREDLAMTEALFAERAALVAWREPMLFLAEQVSARPADFVTLRKWLFPMRKDDLWALPVLAQQLLATLSLDPQVSFTRAQRETIWDYLCHAHVYNLSLWNGGVAVAPYLLVPSDDQAAIGRILARVLMETGVTDLSLRDCTGLTDVSWLQGFAGLAASLKRLDLNHCTGLKDLSGLQGLTGLKSLDLTGCTGLKDLGGLHGLSGLTSLSLHGCTGLCDLSGLRWVPRLTSLSLAGCKGVVDLGALRGLGDLEGLYLSDCTGLRDLEALSGLRDLYTLDLSGCTGVTDLDPLWGLVNLRRIDVRNTPGLVNREYQVARLTNSQPDFELYH